MWFSIASRVNCCVSLLSWDPINPESVTLSLKGCVRTRTLHVNPDDGVKSFPWLSYNCDQIACSFYRGNSFPKSSGIGFGDFRLSFIGTKPLPNESLWWNRPATQRYKRTYNSTEFTRMLLKKYSQHSVKLFSWLNEGCAAVFQRFFFFLMIQHVRVWWAEDGPNISSWLISMTLVS